MSNKIGPGCTIDVGATAAVSVRSAQFNNDGAPINTTQSGSTVQTYENGIPDEELTVEVLGDPAWAVLGNVTGTVDMNDAAAGEAASIASAIITSVQKGFSHDGEFVSNITFKPRE